MSRMSNEEAIAVIKKEAECVKRQGKTGECCRDDLGCGACDLVEKDTNIFAAFFLAIEALNRPHGEWKSFTDGMGRRLHRCSECERVSIEKSFFCPNCGADMRKGGEK